MEMLSPNIAQTGEQDPLTMFGEQKEQKIKTAYQQLMDASSAAITGQMCWPVEWYPEALPTESATGNSIRFHLQAKADPLSVVDGGKWPPADGSDVPKEDVLIFADSYGYCKEILAQAPPGRIGLSNVQTKAVSSYSEKDVQKLVGSQSWDLIILASGIDPPASNSVADIHKQQDAVVKLYLAILKKIGDDATRCKRLVVLTVDCFAEEAEIHEESGLGLITNTTLFGMSNTARYEVQCPIQYIDTEWALRTENTKYLVAEIFRHDSFGHNSVRILNRGRYVLRQVSSKQFERKPTFQLPEDGVIAISGGNGALGLVMGLWILRKAKQQGGKRFSIEFLSRSMKISDQNLTNWKEIEQLAASLGIFVEQAKCDVSKQDSVNEFIQSVTPNLTGFIHSAGILQDSMLMNQSWEKFDAVFEAKSRAALFIHDALERYANPKLKFMWLFSSNSVYGNMGQLNYSASNSFLDGLARHRRAMGKPCMAPQWGAWGDVGMAANLDEASRKRLAAGPMPYFSNAEGLHGLECGLRTGLPYFTVCKYNAPVLFGMVQGDDYVVQHYGRNFSCHVVPPPPGDPKKNPYTTLSYELRKSIQVSDGLVFRHFYPKEAEAMEF